MFLKSILLLHKPRSISEDVDTKSEVEQLQDCEAFCSSTDYPRVVDEEFAESQTPMIGVEEEDVLQNDELCVPHEQQDITGVQETWMDLFGDGHIVQNEIFDMLGDYVDPEFLEAVKQHNWNNDGMQLNLNTEELKQMVGRNQRLLNFLYQKMVMYQSIA